MTVESNDVIAIATLSDWLGRLAPVFQRTMYAWFFPRFELGIVIGSSRCDWSE